MKYLKILGFLLSLQAFAQDRPGRAEMEAKLQAACGPDLSSTCVGKEGREKFRCLIENRAHLSEACASFFAQMPKHGPRPPGPPPAEDAASSR